MAKCQQCKLENGGRCRCKLCRRMICDDCWSNEQNSDYCQRCQGEYNRVNKAEPAPPTPPRKQLPNFTAPCPCCHHEQTCRQPMPQCGYTQMVWKMSGETSPSPNGAARTKWDLKLATAARLKGLTLWDAQERISIESLEKIMEIWPNSYAASNLDNVPNPKVETSPSPAPSRRMKIEVRRNRDEENRVYEYGVMVPDNEPECTGPDADVNTCPLHAPLGPEHCEAAPSPRAEQAFKCVARSANMGANDLQECDWPVCGCDPYADKVIEALQESGKLGYLYDDHCKECHHMHNTVCTCKCHASPRAEGQPLAFDEWWESQSLYDDKPLLKDVARVSWRAALGAPPEKGGRS